MEEIYKFDADDSKLLGSDKVFLCKMLNRKFDGIFIIGGNKLYIKAYRLRNFNIRAITEYVDGFTEGYFFGKRGDK